jgi:hypothetical protein
MKIRRPVSRVMLLAILASLSAVTAVAQPEGDRPRRPDGLPAGPLGGRSAAEMIARADQDGDGRVSRQEFLETRTAEMEAMFDRIDANGDGFLDEREVGQMAERLRAGAEALGIPSAGSRGIPSAGSRGMPAAGSRGMQRPDGERARRPDGEPGFRRPEGRRPENRPEDRPDGRPEGAPLAGEAFDRMDRDGDGSLSREEFTAGMARLREMMQRGGGPPGGMGRPEGRRGPEEGFRRPPRQDAPSAD